MATGPDIFSPWPLAPQAAIESVTTKPGFADILRAEEQIWRSHWTDKSLLVKGNRGIPRFRVDNWKKRIYYPEYAENDEIGDLFSDREELEQHQQEVRAQHANWLASLLLRLHQDVLLLYYTCTCGAVTCHVIHPNSGILESHALCLDLALMLKVSGDQARRLLGKSRKARFCRSSLQVARMLLDPIGSRIEATSWLHIVAEGEVRHLQFHALPWKGAPLISAKMVSYANSLTEMAFQPSCGPHGCGREAVQGLGSAGVAGVACVLAGPLQSRRRGMPRKAAAPWIAQGEPLDDLNAAVCEGNVVHDILTKRYAVYMLQGAELGYEQVCGLRDSLDVHLEGLDASILHVSAHFCLPEGLEEDSYLALSFGNNLPSRHLADAIPDFLDLCLWSVCCSGKLVPGKNEIASLLAGKGCRFSITTEWEIADPAALVYSKSFYQNLNYDVLNVLRAHQEAQKGLLSTPAEGICDEATDLVSKYQCSPAVVPLQGGKMPNRCTKRGAGQPVEMDATASAMLGAIETTLSSLKLDGAHPPNQSQDWDWPDEISIQEFMESFSSLPYWWASHRVYCNAFKDVQAETEEEVASNTESETEDSACLHADTSNMEHGTSLPTLLVPRLVPLGSHVDCLVGLSDSDILCFTAKGEDVHLHHCRFEQDILRILATKELPESKVLSAIFCESGCLVVACQTHCFCCTPEDLQPKWTKINLFLCMAELPGTSTIFAVEGLLGVGNIIAGIKLRAFDTEGMDCGGFGNVQANFQQVAGVPSQICLLRDKVEGFRLVSIGSPVSNEPELTGIDLVSGCEKWRRPCPPDESGHTQPALCRLDDAECLLGSYFFILRFNVRGEFLQQFNCTNSCLQLEIITSSDGTKLLLLGHRQVFVVDWDVAQEQHKQAFKHPEASITFQLEQVLDTDERGHRFEERLWQYMGQEDLLSHCPSDSEADMSRWVESDGADGTDGADGAESTGSAPETAEQIAERERYLQIQHEQVMKRHSEVHSDFTEMRERKRKMAGTEQL